MMYHFDHNKRILSSKMSKLALVILILSLGRSMLDTIWSVYIDSIVNNIGLVGLISGGFAILSVIFMIFSTPIIVKYPEARLWILSAITSAIGFASFYFISNIWLLLFFGSLITFSGVIRLQSHGIIVRDLSNQKNIGKNEGLQYALNNAGWMIGPLLAGFITANLGVRPVFLFSTIFFVIGIIMFKNLRIKNVNHFTKDDGTIKSVIKNLFSYFKNKERIKHYVISGGVNLYWGILYVFMPLFILEQQIGEQWIGIFLFSVAIPLVLIEYKVGALADIQGFKKFFVIGYAILATGSLIAFFVTSAYAWMLIFFITSFGAGFLESTTESYFFKLVKRNEEEKYYGPYNTGVFMISALGKLAAGGLLFFFAQKYVFLLLAIEMIILLLVAISIKEKRTTHQ